MGEIPYSPTVHPSYLHSQQSHGGSRHRGSNGLTPLVSRSGGVAFFITQVSVTYAQKPLSSESSTPAKNSTPADFNPSTNLSTSTISHHHFKCAVRHIFEYVQLIMFHLPMARYRPTADAFGLSPTESMGLQYPAILSQGQGRRIACHGRLRGNRDCRTCN